MWLQTAAQLPLPRVGQSQIQVVATQYQMIAYGNAMKLHFVVFTAADSDQCKVGRSATNVANQDFLPRFHAPVPILGVSVDPGIERRLRFFDQHNPR